MISLADKIQQIEEAIFNNTGISFAEVVEYYPDTQTIRVKLLPDGLITTDIPINSPYSGRKVGMISPFYKGQQVTVGFIGSINNPVLLGGNFNLVSEQPPTKKGIRQKYGKLINKIIDPLKDFLITNNSNVLLMNDTVGTMLNSNKWINLVASKPITTLSPYINQIGDLNINLPTDITEKIIDIYTQLDDMNNKYAQVQALADANKKQQEKMGMLIQFLTWVVHIIGLSPIKVVNIYDLYPALAGNPFMKYFTSSMTDMKAIQLFSLQQLKSGVTSKFKSIGERIKQEGISGVQDEISNITNTFNIGGDIGKYLNLFDFDIDAIIKADRSDIGPLIIQNLPTFDDSKSKSKNIINKMSSYIKQAFYYYEIVRKQYDRITNSAYFKNPHTGTNNDSWFSGTNYEKTDTAPQIFKQLGFITAPKTIN